MSKYKVTDESFLKQVKLWIESDGEIYVDIYFPQTGGGSQGFLLTSYNEFVQVLSYIQNRIGGIIVIRYPKFILRGIANAELLEKAIEIFPEGRDWWLICPNHDDISQSRATGDKTYQELRETFERFNNKYIAMGFDDDFPPFWPPKYSEEILEAEFG